MLFPLIKLKEDSDPNTISNDERIKFIEKCNLVDQNIEVIMTKHNTMLGEDQIRLLVEKKEYINSLRDIVNDLTFKSKQQFVELHKILKEIFKDVTIQLNGLNQYDSNQNRKEDKRNEIVNMLVHRMIYDASKKSLKDKEAISILKLNEDENGQKLLEKYIVKVIKKELKKEMTKTGEQAQDMNVVTNEQLKKRLDILENTVQKLGSIESLYDKIHSRNKEQKRRIMTLVQEPVKKSMEPIKTMMEPSKTIAEPIKRMAESEPKPEPRVNTTCTVKKEIISMSDKIDLAGALLLNDGIEKNKKEKKKDKKKEKKKKSKRKSDKSLEQCIKNKTSKTANMIFVIDDDQK